MSAGFESWAEIERSKINDGLISFFKGDTKILEICRYPLNTGGKRVRPLITLAASRALGKPENPIAMHYGMAVELIHTYSLVHDDLPCMDDDDVRRNKPTVHKKYDVPAALLAGDALLTHAFEALARLESTALRDATLVLAQAAGACGMIGGQSYDIGIEGPITSEAALVRLHRMKTGALITAAAELGALASGATPEQRLTLKQYGSEIGLAFQLADDVLDAEEDAEENGPPSFVKFYGIDNTIQKAQELAEQAKSRVKNFPMPDMLFAIADFTVNRKY